MKKTGILILLLWTFVSVSQTDPFYSYERILSYHSDIIVKKDCHVLIQETIEVVVLGNKIQRGIYREIPLSYAYKGGNTHVGFELLEVKRNGENEPFHTKSMSNGIRIYAGDEDVFLPDGVHTYTFTYDVNHVLGFYDDYDEIYWNVNGNGWDFEIESVSANVYYPEGAELIAFDGYTGAYGDVKKNFLAEKIQGGVQFKGTARLWSGENLSVVVAWNKNQVIYPTAWEEFVYWVQSYILWIIGVLGILIGFGYNFVMWWKYGRDPEPGTIIPMFYAPDDMSPAECAYLLRGGKQTTTMFGSTLISLATKRMLQIEVEGESGRIKKNKYTITKLENPAPMDKHKLNIIERKFCEELFKSSDTIVIDKAVYNPALKSLNMQLTRMIDARQKGVYFLRNTFLKGRQYIFPLLTTIIGIIAYSVYGGAIPVLIAAVVLHIIMNIIFGRLFEQPTKEGRKRMDEIQGFRMYMKYADKERIKLMNPPTMDFAHFEENLAYAIALNVAEEWSGQFDPGVIEEATLGHMPYYHGMALASFGDFSDSLSSTISSASTPPASSGSGSGGGGFSGGGGGGGGGGGW